MKIVLFDKTVDKSEIRLTKEIKRRLDTEWSKAVKRRDKRCQNPLCTNRKSALEAHHIKKRKHLPLRWDLSNGVTFCYKCHRFIIHGHGKEAEQKRAVIEAYLDMKEREEKLQSKLERLGRAS